MATKYCYNALTGEIFNYEVEGDWTDFPRGTLMAYGDYITTGFKSRKEAEVWAKEWSACPSCKCERKGKHGETCGFCGSALESHYAPNPVE